MRAGHAVAGLAVSRSGAAVAIAGPMAGGAGAYVDVAAPVPVVDAVWIRQGGRHPHAGEELAEVGGVAGAADGRGRYGHHGRGVRVAGPPPPLAVVPAHGGRQPRSPAEFVDGAGLGVVGGEDHGAGTLPGWQ